MVIIFHNREIYKWMNFGLICMQSWTVLFSNIWNTSPQHHPLILPWFSLLYCSLNCFRHPPCKDNLLNREAADSYMLWGEGNATSSLGGVNKLGNVATDLLIISAQFVHCTSVQEMNGIGHGHPSVEYKYLFWKLLGGKLIASCFCLKPS